MSSLISKNQSEKCCSDFPGLYPRAAMSEICRLCCRGRELMNAVLSGITQTMRENRKDRSGYLPDILRRRLITSQPASITLPVHTRIESSTRTGHRRWAFRRYMRRAVTGKGRPASTCPHPLFRRIRPDKKKQIMFLERVCSTMVRCVKAVLYEIVRPVTDRISRGLIASSSRPSASIQPLPAEGRNIDGGIAPVP